MEKVRRKGIMNQLLPFSLLLLAIFGHADASRAFAPLRHPSFVPRLGRRRSSGSNVHYNSRPTGLEFLEPQADEQEVKLCGLGRNLLSGAFLRVSSDILAGTPLESIKCRVTTTFDGPIQATRNIVNEGGFWALWAGTPSRTVEGMLLGAVYILGSSITKNRMQALGASPVACSLCGGLVGGVAQSIVMTPAGMVFTSLNVNQGKKGYENDNAITVTRRILKEKGVMGMYYGVKPMAMRQASNWATRSGLTEVCRTALKLQNYGVMGEIASGAIGGIGSLWNTPIETIRVLIAKDVSMGKPTGSMGQYWSDIVEEQGYPGLFREIGRAHV